jgi:enoyl-CoA hydratase/carnithine racemase
VTVAEVAGELASPALDVALCSDLIYLRPRANLRLASFRLLFAAVDPEEGARAFLEKRDPKF